MIEISEPGSTRMWACRITKYGTVGMLCYDSVDNNPPVQFDFRPRPPLTLLCFLPPCTFRAASSKLPAAPVTDPPFTAHSFQQPQHELKM